jgi:hypothetical protein
MPNLLDLPPEIRNPIYEYALTEPRRLFYYKGPSGIASLHRIEDENPSPVPEEEGEADWRKIMILRQLPLKGCSWYSIYPRRPLQQGVNDQSIVNRWVVATYTHRGLNDERIIHEYSFQEGNQLRFVNRQLYWETRGLGIRYNDIFFIRQKGANMFGTVEDTSNFLT